MKNTWQWVMRAAAAAALALITLAGTAAPGAAAQHAPDSHERELVTAVELPGGIVKVTIYTPAPGVSVEQLAANLGITAPARVIRPMDPFQCYYGTAYALDSGRCPPIKWSGTRPVVYFRDYSNANWPFSAAIPSWNTSPDIDVWHRTSACPSGSHCVTVYNGNYGATGLEGETTYSYYTTSRTFVDGTVVIKVNDYYHSTYSQRRQTACHEVGHAIGVGHNVSTASCIYAVGGTAQNPSGDDINLLTHVIY
ncbi:hypothetical protein [Catellatospora sp. NPDC049609]|uniref:hypothetical protein n=1 Tax=Catellatospora sp. NPDC049609 TaxID=3155505 RepID=UPI00341EFC5E